MGELTLRRVAELSGMAPQCDFFEQHSSDGQRPDMIVKLPGGRTLAVDAKVPLSAYLDAEAAVDDPSRRAALDRHSQQVMRHVMQLGAREYWSRLQPSPEMVVLFMAGDHFLAAALERDPELLEKALARKVLLATPVTLVSVLKGVAYPGVRKNSRKMPASFVSWVRSCTIACASSPTPIPRPAATWQRPSTHTTDRPRALKRASRRRSNECAN